MGEDSAMTQNFEQMLRQLDKTDLLPPPSLQQASSEVIEDRVQKPLTAGDRKSSAMESAATDQGKQGKRRRSNKDKSNKAKERDQKSQNYAERNQS